MGLAGRRIDAPGTEYPVFPLENAIQVQERVLRLLLEKDVRTLVCSAACGADLVALQAAESLNIRRRIILPFDPGRFRSSSVTDRPGDWGPIYDRIVSAATTAGDLVNLQLAECEEAYFAANAAILNEALRLSDSSGDRAAVALVWNGISKGEEDNSVFLGEAARDRGLSVFNVSTL